MRIFREILCENANYVNPHCHESIYSTTIHDNQQIRTRARGKKVARNIVLKSNSNNFAIYFQSFFSLSFFFYYRSRLSNLVAKVAIPIVSLSPKFHKGELYNEPVVKVQLSSSEKGTRSDW